MKIGKWYLAIRIGDLCVGIGRPPASLKAKADLSRKHRGIK